MSGSLFDIVGPVMVGPSSSHTAGAVRLASLARLIADRAVASVEFILFNSFAQTYKGHGTDRGLVAGILGYGVDDVRIRDAFECARKEGLKYNITPYTKTNNHPPNTVQFLMELDNGEKLSVIGHSVGAGRIYVSKINGYNVSLKGELPTVILFYKDQPGMIWRVTKIIAEHNVNIATLQCSRRRRGVEAFMTITLDEPLDPAQVAEIAGIPDVYMVRSIDRLPS